MIALLAYEKGVGERAYDERATRSNVTVVFDDNQMLIQDSSGGAPFVNVTVTRDIDNRVDSSGKWFYFVDKENGKKRAIHSDEGTIRKIMAKVEELKTLNCQSPKILPPPTPPTPKRPPPTPPTPAQKDPTTSEYQTVRYTFVKSRRLIRQSHSLHCLLS